MDITRLVQLQNGIIRGVALDTNTLVVDNLKIKLGNASNHVTFSGSLTANRTIIFPDNDVDLSPLASNSFIRADGTVAMAANLDLGGYEIANLGMPTSANSAVSKAYVDSLVEGLKPKEAVRVATTTSITLSGLQAIDSINISVDDRVLVKDQTNPAENGIYLAKTGAWVRAPDFDSTSPVNEINGAYVAVQEGNDNAGKFFVQVGNVSTLGTDPINFVFFNSVAALGAGSGIDITNNTISIANNGVEYYHLNAGAVTNSAIASDAVTEDKIDNSAFVGLEKASSTNGKIYAYSISFLNDANRVTRESFTPGLYAIRTPSSNTESAGIYKADYNGNDDKWHVAGLMHLDTSAAANTSIGPSRVISRGYMQLGNALYTSSDIGSPIYLGANGSTTLTPPTAPDTVVYIVGYVLATNAIYVDPKFIGIN